VDLADTQTVDRSDESRLPESLYAKAFSA
jgi:hypothetical protein